MTSITLNSEGMTIIMVTHNSDYAAHADRVLRVTDGQLTQVSREEARSPEGISHPRPVSNYVMLDVGLGQACKLAGEYVHDDGMFKLRERFWTLLQDAFGNGAALNGHPIHRLPNTLNVSFVGKAGGAILSRLDGVAASTGSACHAGSVELSPVLKAMGVTDEAGMGAIRFSLGRTTTLQELEMVVRLLKNAVSCRN